MASGPRPIPASPAIRQRSAKGLRVIPAFASGDKPAAVQFTHRMHAAGVLVIPAGMQTIRLLPPLNLKPQEAGEGISKIEEVEKSLAS